MEILSVYQLVNVSVHAATIYLLFIYYELVSMSII